MSSALYISDSATMPVPFPSTQKLTMLALQQLIQKGFRMLLQLFHQSGYFLASLSPQQFMQFFGRCYVQVHYFNFVSRGCSFMYDQSQFAFAYYEKSIITIVYSVLPRPLWQSGPLCLHCLFSFDVGRESIDVVTNHAHPLCLNTCLGRTLVQREISIIHCLRYCLLVLHTHNNTCNEVSWYRVILW